MVDSDAGSAEVSPGTSLERPLVVRTSSAPHVFARVVLFWCAFALGASSVWLGARRAIEVFQIGEVPLAFSLQEIAHDFSTRLGADPARHRIAMIGDSTLWPAKGMRSPDIQTLPARLETALHKYGELADGVTLHTLRIPGLTIAGMYFVSDEIIAAHPDQIVLALNLHGLNREAQRKFSRIEVAGWLRGQQFLEALGLPLFDTGLTTDRLLFYRTLVASGAAPSWRSVEQLQGRAFKLREALAERLDAQLGTRASADLQRGLALAHLGRFTIEVAGRPRMSRESAQRNLAPVLRGVTAREPTLRVLAALLARFRRAHIPTLVYIEPINVEHVRQLGFSLDGLSRSLRSIRRTVESAGAQLADLHAVLPDGAFRDEGDHYTFAGQPNGTFRLASQLASVLRARLPPIAPGDPAHAVQ
jgi:hypothetical protein